LPATHEKLLPERLAPRPRRTVRPPGAAGQELAILDAAGGRGRRPGRRTPPSLGPGTAAAAQQRTGLRRPRPAPLAAYPDEPLSPSPHRLPGARPAGAAPGLWPAGVARPRARRDGPVAAHARTGGIGADVAAGTVHVDRGRGRRPLPQPRLAGPAGPGLQGASAAAARGLGRETTDRLPRRGARRRRRY